MEYLQIIPEDEDFPSWYETIGHKENTFYLWTPLQATYWKSHMCIQWICYQSYGFNIWQSKDGITFFLISILWWLKSKQIWSET